jgi:pimeloyl-ACP methyl ester carboxylesterase
VGAEDMLTPPRYSRALATHIAGAGVTEVPASGHCLFWEKPEEFTKAVLGFLQRQGRRR